MEQTNKRELLQTRILKIKKRIEYVETIKLNNDYTVILSIYPPTFPNVEQIDFDTDQEGSENLMNLSSCFLFLYLVNLNAILDELKNQLNNGSN